MGCASSKQNKRCRHCQTPYSPVLRSNSMHVRHPAQGKGDSHHVVALTSTTLGSLKLDFDKNNQNNNRNAEINGGDHLDVGGGGGGGDKSKDAKDFSIGLVEAKAWSSMIEEKIPKVVPKTPIRTPPGEPETINTWELMEGLEDVSPLMMSHKHFRSFSFDVAKNLNSNAVVPLDDHPLPKSELSESKATVSPKCMWNQMSDGDDDKNSNFVSEFDPEVIQTFRKSFQELSPGHPFHLRPQLETKKQQSAVADNGLLLSDSLEGKKAGNGVVSDKKFGKEKLVLYFTTLRGVRKTYEDCCHVRVILKSLSIRVDERDVSMHSGFKEELKELLRNGITGGTLPRVFLGKKCIGGAEEIRRLHEEGQLEKMLEGCEKVDEFGGTNGATCEACRDIRFVLCETCSGSCKIYHERDEEEQDDDEDQEQWEGEEGESGFQRCPDCNENGLIRCPICCY
ncbi:uncharacterized protein At3g28850-like [Mangifera indica]|uniref:uncharacterized protein At3g28850-like n=1 Tax=Mangifera indica TaxID=29780 RepID=UPI001CFBD689|nr:uncharacterized protein At3g28850-like [Mangifera indica]